MTTNFFFGEWKVFRDKTRKDDIQIEDDPLNPSLVRVTFKSTVPTSASGYISTVTGATGDPRFFFIHIEEPLSSTDVRHYLGRVTFPASYDPTKPVDQLSTIINGRAVVVSRNAPGAMSILADEDWTSNRPVA